MKQQGRTTKQHNDDQTDPLHGFNFAVAKVQPANLQQGGRNRHTCGDVNSC